EIEGPQGKGKVKILGNPLKFEKTPVKTFTPPPRLGQNTREILTQILGYSKEKIDYLVQKGFVKAE
ncbi:MAG TPA: CoA transferase, partial [Thermodesulfobacteriota bacterium]|nr:CoA transferase [Thermodesulfobacteriota bacterium]